jgi:hypothetical protein
MTSPPPPAAVTAMPHTLLNCFTVSVLEAPVGCTKGEDGTSWEPTHPTTTAAVLASASSEISEVGKMTEYTELGPSPETASCAVAQLLKTSPTPIKSSPHHSSYLTWLLILFSDLSVCLPRDIIPSGFLTKILHAFFSSPCVLHALTITYSLIL